jgi:hypothetical protein
MNDSTRRAPVRRMLRRAAVSSVAGAGITAAAFATACAIGHYATLEIAYQSSSDDYLDFAPYPEDVTTEVARLVADHHCWTDRADMPANMDGRMPGHVVVTTAAAPTTAVYSAELVGPALEQVFTPYADADLTVYAFCR